MIYFEYDISRFEVSESSNCRRLQTCRHEIPPDKAHELSKDLYERYLKLCGKCTFPSGKDLETLTSIERKSSGFIYRLECIIS